MSYTSIVILLFASCEELPTKLSLYEELSHQVSHMKNDHSRKIKSKEY